jgi:hypothetical protein
MLNSIEITARLLDGGGQQIGIYVLPIRLEIPLAMGRRGGDRAGGTKRAIARIVPWLLDKLREGGYLDRED